VVNPDAPLANVPPLLSGSVALSFSNLAKTSFSLVGDKSDSMKEISRLKKFTAAPGPTFVYQTLKANGLFICKNSARRSPAPDAQEFPFEAL
jgi:hypothetical protein